MADFYSFLKESSDNDLIRYYFNTQFGYTYIATFYFFDKYSDLPGEFPYLKKYAYMFSFGPDSESEGLGKRKSDNRIAPTIIKIIKDFYHSFNQEIVVVFHADMVDNKHKARARLFEQWYEGDPIKEAIHFDSLEVVLPQSVQYLGLFIFKTHKYQNEVIDEFKLQSLAIMREK